MNSGGLVMTPSKAKSSKAVIKIYRAGCQSPAHKEHDVSKGNCKITVKPIKEIYEALELLAERHNRPIEEVATIFLEEGFKDQTKRMKSHIAMKRATKQHLKAVD